jgi:hypothetical protein
LRLFLQQAGDLRPRTAISHQIDTGLPVRKNVSPPVIRWCAASERWQRHHFFGGAKSGTLRQVQFCWRNVALVHRPELISQCLEKKTEKIRDLSDGVKLDYQFRFEERLHAVVSRLRDVQPQRKIAL